MPYLTGLFIQPHGELAELRLNVTRSHPGQTIKNLFAGGAESDLVMATCKLGVMYSLGGENKTLNTLASAICADSSSSASAAANREQHKIYGPCFLVGEDQQGKAMNLPAAAKERVAELFKQVVGGKLPPGIVARKVKREGPKKAKKAVEFFKRAHFEKRSTELRDQNLPFVITKENVEAIQAWSQMTAEMKAPYLEAEAQDKARYDTEYADYVIKNPPKPSRARTAVFFYHQAHPNKEGRPEFTTLSEEQKKEFETQAAADKERYETQLSKFKAHCEATGKSFEEEMKPRRRSSAAVGAAVSPARKTKTKSVEPARKPGKKLKTSDGQAAGVKHKKKTQKASEPTEQNKKHKKKDQKKRKAQPEEEENEGEEEVQEDNEEEEEDEEAAAGSDADDE